LLFLIVTRLTSDTGFMPSFCTALRAFFSERLCLPLCVPSECVCVCVCVCVSSACVGEQKKDGQMAGSVCVWRLFFKFGRDAQRLRRLPVCIRARSRVRSAAVCACACLKAAPLIAARAPLLRAKRGRRARTAVELSLVLVAADVLDLILNLLRVVTG
jgi:hypothetical protein